MQRKVNKIVQSIVCDSAVKYLENRKENKKNIPSADLK